MRFQRTVTAGGELLALLRPLWCFIALVSFGQGVGLLPAWAAPAPTITTLSVFSGGNAVTTVAQGNVVTLTATVMAGGTPVTPGQVNFCDATAKFCTDIHLLGTAQLTANGTATLKFRPGVGSHSYKAVLAEPAGLGPSASTTSSLTVTASQGTGQLATTTYLEASGVPNIFSLTATVPGNGNALPTGTVSFVDASNGNAVLGTAALMSETDAGFAGSSLLNVASQNSGNTVLTADFNGDGIPDLVLLGDDTISVLLGNGDGTFTAAPSPSNDLPGAIAVGDFNGDGIPDLAVAPAFDEGNSEVLLGNGDGTFTIANGSFGNGNGTVASNSIAAADFNGDGKLDLVEACASINEQPCNLLLILFGNGDGTFTQPFMQSSFAPLPFFGSQSMVVGDFNGDGQPDLAVTNSGANGVNVFLNNEGGLTAVPAIPVTGASPSSIAAADFNGDGKLDLAVANSGSNNVTILLGNGDGTFTAAASPATGTAPNSIAVADFNGDGVPDLAVANAGSSNVTILLGNGDGTFTAAAGPAADTGSTSVVAADFNGDGKEDLVVANSRDSSATALLAETALTIATVNNISPVGVGTHLVKAIYSGDVNYGGSTSADVSLIVVPPGLTLSGTSVSVVAGATGTSTLTITPTNGFSGTVTLECNFSYVGGANDVPTCSSTVTISGNAPTTTTLSIQTQPGTTPEQYTLGVNAVDSSGNLIANTNTAIVAVTVTAPAPSFAQISGISPNYGAPAALIDITGINFGAVQGNGSVTVGGAPSRVISWSNTAIAIQVPSRATTGNIVVTASGEASNGAAFTFYPYPAISGVSPAGGAVGTPVTITGANLLDGEGHGVVTFNGIPAPIISQSSTSIQVNVPAGATSGPVTVHANSDTVKGSSIFSVTHPQISGISPNYGAPAALIKITGTNFGATQGNGSVTVGGAPSHVVSWSNNAIAFQVPSHANTGNIVVTEGGEASNGAAFTFYPYPAITEISPASGPVGTPVTITGTGLMDAEGHGAVTFNGIPAAIVSQSESSIEVNVPPGATNGPITVHANGDTVKSSTGFTATHPQISTISPDYGAPAALVTITGTNFGATRGNGNVTVGGAPSYVVSWSNTAIAIEVPSRATTGNIVLTTEGEASNGAPFTFYSEPSITSLSANSGPVGTSVTITGNNLQDGGNNPTVTFNGTPATVSSDTSGSIRVTVPTGSTSGRLLVKINGVTVVASTSFDVTPPAS